MFSLGLSSVLGNRENSTKKPADDDEWYIPYNGPYEAPPRDMAAWRRKHRDSWGDPIPSGVGNENLELTADESVDEKRKYNRRYDAHVQEIKYGVQGVFDKDLKQLGRSDSGRFGSVLEGREGEGSVGRGRDRPSSFGPIDLGKTGVSTSSRRRSTISSGNSLAAPDYIPVSGGVGESPVPPSRTAKDANRISLASIFTFGARMRTGSPTMSMDGEREKRVDSLDYTPKRSARSSVGKEKVRARVNSSPVHPSTSTQRSKKHGQQNEQPDNQYLQMTGEDYYDHYNTFYSTLVEDDNENMPDHPFQTSRKPVQNGRQHSQPQQVHPSSTTDPPRADQPTQPVQQRLRRKSRQNVAPQIGGHPYAPYAPFANQNDFSELDQDGGVGTSTSFTHTANNPPVFRHQKHPYNQAQLTSTRHPHGQNSVSTGASSASHSSHLPKRGSGFSHGRGAIQQAAATQAETVTGAVASDLGSIGVGTVGIGVSGSRSRARKLKSSMSTPNLRRSQCSDELNAANPFNAIDYTAPPVPPSATKRPSLPRSMDRWLCPETWCDALLFPRPRLKIKQDKVYTFENQFGISGGAPVPSPVPRVVSPPDSPLGGDWDVEILNGVETQFQNRGSNQYGAGPSGQGQRQREPGIASRVLAHSKSLVDIRTKSSTERQRAGYGVAMPTAMPTDEVQVEARYPKENVTAESRWSISQERQHFEFPATVPDLSEVLAEGRLLEEERQAWQALATHSFGNKRTRSLSRTRTKSLTKKGRASMRKRANSTAGISDPDVDGRRGQSNIEYLAAQACLGNQNLTLTPAFSTPDLDSMMPNIPPTSSSHGHEFGHSHSNSHSTSVVRTLTTRSSKSHPKTHSRNNSFGNPAVGRINMGRLCGNPVLDVDIDLDKAERANFLGSAAPSSQGAHHRTAPDLEGALKRHGTRVIRLADPAHIPVDKGLPTSQSVSTNLQQENKTPSPAFSAAGISVISESQVGIAIGTPPEEAEVVQDVDAGVSAAYLSHPYAQRGLSFGNKLSSSAKTESVSPHPASLAPAASESKALPISDILAHKAIAHPYASSSSAATRDVKRPSRLVVSVSRGSYLEANPLIGRFRSEDREPDPSKMWAQLSPGEVREILPDDFQYSPYNIKGQDQEETRTTPGHLQRQGRMKSIHDTTGVAEALLSTTRYGKESRELGEDQPDWVQAIGRSASYQPSTFEPSASRLPLLPSTDDSGPFGLALSTGDSSRQVRPLGSPNDLESYQDLFYRPSSIATHHSQLPPEAESPISPIAPVSWDTAVRNRETGSGLTSLARQLGEEYEALASGSASRESSIYSHSRSRSLGAYHSGPFGLSTTEGNLQFVLEEMPHEKSHDKHNPDETMHAFQLASLPEDVYSSQASSIMENVEEDDPTATLRLGMIESVSTPPVVDVERRVSFNSETVYKYDAQGDNSHEIPRALIPDVATQVSYRTDVGEQDTPAWLGSQRPLTQVTRSSYMTTSDLSRISNLSDFPAPPRTLHSDLTPQHISLFKPDLEEEPRISDTPTSPSLSGYQSRKTGPFATSDPLPDTPGHGELKFGDNQSADELAKSLSSPDAT